MVRAEFARDVAHYHSTRAHPTVMEPTSTGIGGDCFALYFDASTGTVHGMNGAGKSPAALTLERARQDCLGADAAGAPPASSISGPGTVLPKDHAHAVTVPGAASGWLFALDKWGSRAASEVLEPAAALAERGYPISTITANSWAAQAPTLRAVNGVSLADDAVPDGSPWPVAGPIAPHPQCAFLRPDGSAPAEGDLMTNPDLARTLREVATAGHAAFYKGRIAEAIVEAVQSRGGVLSLDDLADQAAEQVTPLSVRYRGVDVWEIPPAGQGIVALMALNTLQHHDLSNAGKPGKLTTAQYVHTQVQALRLAFADGRMHICDPEHAQVSPSDLLDAAYGEQRAGLIHPTSKCAPVEGGFPVHSSDTVSFQVVDGAGNAVSFINSNYTGFGSCIVPRGCGFTLQNRGANFSLTPGHPNAVAPRKAPYHTIIPGMITEEGRLWATFSVMGGFMQPQGHVQVVCSMVDGGLGPQEALDAPRFCLPAGTGDCEVAVEPGLESAELTALQGTVHSVQGWGRSLFGRGQVIRALPGGVLAGGSDGRGDGCAVATGVLCSK